MEVEKMGIRAWLGRVLAVCFSIFWLTGVLLSLFMLDSLYVSETVYDASLNLQSGYADVLAFVFSAAIVLVYAPSGILLIIAALWRRSKKLAAAGALCVLLAAGVLAGHGLIMDMIGDKAVEVYCGAQELSALLEERARLGLPPPANLAGLGEPARRLIGFAQSPPGIIVTYQADRGLFIRRSHHEGWLHEPGKGWRPFSEEGTAMDTVLPVCRPKPRHP